jgi:hypothetical protein
MSLNSRLTRRVPSLVTVPTSLPVGTPPGLCKFLTQGRIRKTTLRRQPLGITLLGSDVSKVASVTVATITAAVEKSANRTRHLRRIYRGGDISGSGWTKDPSQQRSVHAPRAEIKPHQAREMPYLRIVRIMLPHTCRECSTEDRMSRTVVDVCYAEWAGEWDGGMLHIVRVCVYVQGSNIICTIPPVVMAAEPSTLQLVSVRYIYCT